jgi:DNA-binding response OmpR family regulator
MEHVWSADGNPFSNTVEAHVRNVRLKLNAGGAPDMIANLPGRGYVLDDPESLARL